MNSTLRRNSLWLLLARMGVQILAVIFTAVIARKLGVDAFGRFAWIASLLLIGNTFTNFGTDTFLIRETARASRVTEIAAQSLTLQIFLSILYCAAMLIYHDRALFLYSLALFPLAIYSVNNALLRALNRMDLFLFLSLANGISQLIAVFFSVDVLSLCIFLLVGQLALSAISIWVCYASLPNLKIFSLANFFPILKLTLPFAALTILLVLIQRLGILFVSAQLDNVSTGLFSAITRVVEGLKLGHYAILGALLPAISRGTADSWRSFRKAFSLLLLASFIFAVLLLIFANPIIFILYGNEFIPASAQLALLGWSLVPYTISSFISYDLIARGFEGVVVKSALISFFIYIGLYLWLIHARGFSGAVTAALFGEILQALVFSTFYAKQVRIYP